MDNCIGIGGKGRTQEGAAFLFSCTCSKSIYDASVMNSPTPITKEQIKNLILNAYGFMAKDNALYYCQDDYVHDEMFELVTNDGDCFEFRYTNASVCNGNVMFEDTMGMPIEFTVLIVPTAGSQLMPRLLQ